MYKAFKISRLVYQDSCIKTHVSIVKISTVPTPKISIVKVWVWCHTTKENVARCALQMSRKNREMRTIRLSCPDVCNKGSVCASKGRVAGKSVWKQE